MKQWAVKLTLDYGLADHPHKENQTFVERCEVWFQLPLPFRVACQIPTPAALPGLLAHQNPWKKACKSLVSLGEQEEEFHLAFLSSPWEKATGQQRVDVMWRAHNNTGFRIQNRDCTEPSLKESCFFRASVFNSSPSWGGGAPPTSVLKTSSSTMFLPPVVFSGESILASSRILAMCWGG